MYLFFFFKKKTAYEMLRSRVGSEMCIRDSFHGKEGVISSSLIVGSILQTAWQGENKPV